MHVAKDYVPAAADDVLGVVGYVDEWANYVDLEVGAKKPFLSCLF